MAEDTPPSAETARVEFGIFMTTRDGVTMPFGTETFDLSAAAEAAALVERSFGMTVWVVQRRVTEWTTQPLHDQSFLGDGDMAARFVAGVGWPLERHENRDSWAPRMLADANLREHEIDRARARLEAAIAVLRDPRIPPDSREAGDVR